MMNKHYTDAIAFLLSLTDMERRTDLSAARAQLGLERMQEILIRLDHPERTFWAMHVAGTKGKGSTCAMIERVLRGAGLRTGLYTSPHLHTFRERMRVDGRPITQDALASLMAEIRPIIESIPDRPTTFEAATALAFLHFARQHVDAAVIEVGLGGRLDATNVILPRISVITSLSYDHTAVLGNTLAEIAREKGGIIKPGIPVVASPQSAEARAVIEQICRERQAPLTLIGRDVRLRSIASSVTGVTVQVDGPSYSHRIHVPLMGEHQATNAATAVAALELLRHSGVEIEPQQIVDGLRQVRWPGRLEVIGQRPTILVDGAHNVDSAQKLRAALDACFPLDGAQPRPARPRVLLLGMSSDKDVAGIMSTLVPGADAVVVTRANHPRAADLDRLSDAARRHAANVLAIPGIEDALAEARALAGSEGIICAAGSLFIVADVRALVKGLHQEILLAG
jgi:dihydrofolate synthase / folylpolyglutamate synthase